MTFQGKTTVKSYFETGDYPTQAQFGELIDSYQDSSTVLSYIASAAASAASGAFLASDGAGSVVFVPVGQMNIASGILNIGADIRVSGSATFQNNLVVQGRARVSALNAATAEVSGSAAFAANVEVSGRLTAGQVADTHAFFVDSPSSATTYDWVKSTPYAYTLLGIRRIANAGDCIIDIRKNNSSLATYSASAAVASAALTATTFAQGDNLTVVVTSVSSCTGLAVYANITRVL